MLVRNDKDTGWSEEFWGDVARVSRINREVAPRTDSPEGRVKVGRYAAVAGFNSHVTSGCCRAACYAVRRPRVRIEWFG
jgi:hypothetical protein